VIANGLCMDTRSGGSVLRIAEYADPFRRQRAIEKIEQRLPVGGVGIRHGAIPNVDFGLTTDLLDVKDELRLVHAEYLARGARQTQVVTIQATCQAPLRADGDLALLWAVTASVTCGAA
jgi:hypothetical protein